MAPSLRVFTCVCVSNVLHAAQQIFEVSAVDEAPAEGEEGGLKRGQDLNGGAIVAGHRAGRVRGLRGVNLVVE
jgi:hypothetical protein